MEYLLYIYIYMYMKKGNTLKTFQRCEYHRIQINAKL